MLIYLTLVGSNLKRNLTKIIFFAIALLVLSAIIAVLWQRQPKTAKEESVEIAQTLEKKDIAGEAFTINPASGSVVNISTIKLEGKTLPQSTVLIYSNNSQFVLRSNDSGNFEKEINLEDGLNLFKVVVLSENLEIKTEKNLDLFFSASDTGKALAAGSVKSIFDSLITVTTTGGDTNIRTSKSTNFDVPEEEGVEEATREVDNIRIGDYVIATGDASDEDSLLAKEFSVLRQDKPKLLEEVVVGKIASALKQNLFSVKNNKEGQIVEFKLTKDSSVLESGEESGSADITKDKTAILFYTKAEKENLLDLIYLLP